MFLLCSDQWNERSANEFAPAGTLSGHLRKLLIARAAYHKRECVNSKLRTRRSTPQRLCMFIGAQAATLQSPSPHSHSIVPGGLLVTS